MICVIFSTKLDEVINTHFPLKVVMSKSQIQNKFPAHFNINEKQIMDKEEIAEKLSSFFINIGPKLANELDPVGQHRETRF